MVVVTINILVSQAQSRGIHLLVEKLVLLLQEEQEDYEEERHQEHRRMTRLLLFLLLMFRFYISSICVNGWGSGHIIQ